MNIVFVTSLWLPDSAGGASRVITEEAHRLAQRGHRVVVLTRQIGDRPVLEEAGNLTIYRYPLASHGVRFHATEMLAGRRETARLLKAGAQDIIHIHLPLVGVGAAWSAFKKAPIVASFYSIWALEWEQEQEFEAGKKGLSLGQRLLYRYLLELDRFVGRRAHSALVLSRFGQELCEEHLGIRTGRIRLIPGGVDGDVFSPRNRDEAWRSSKASSEAILLFTARRLVARTGVDQLLRACALLRERQVPFTLIVAGEGDQREALEQLRKDLALEDSVEFVGHVPEQDLYRMMASCDLFVLPTLAYEGFGMATVEALASGTPVLGTPVGATPEVLKLLDSRLLARSSRAQDLAEAIELLARDRPGLEVLKQACRAYALERFGWKAHMDKLEEAYREALGSGVAAPRRRERPRHEDLSRDQLPPP